MLAARKGPLVKQGKHEFHQLIFLHLGLLPRKWVPRASPLLSESQIFNSTSEHTFQFFSILERDGCILNWITFTHAGDSILRSDSVR